MLMRTLEFYKRTEEGNDLMMNIIRAKDQQLEEALDQLNKMKVVQAKLVEESQNLTDQADDYADRMRMMLQSKEQDVDDIVRQLEQLKAGIVFPSKVKQYHLDTISEQQMSSCLCGMYMLGLS